MTHHVGLDVSQKTTAICIIDDAGRRLWRGQYVTDTEQTSRVVTRHGGENTRVGLETGPMTPWLVRELRSRGLSVTCLDARHAKAALSMRINKRSGAGSEIRSQPYPATIMPTGGDFWRKQLQL
jgi:transposase